MTDGTVLEVVIDGGDRMGLMMNAAKAVVGYKLLRHVLQRRQRSTTSASPGMARTAPPSDLPPL